MKHWKLIIYGTALWSIISGITLILRDDIDAESNLTWNKGLVGWAMLVSGSFMFLVRIFIELMGQPKTNTLLWIELGAVCGAAAMRIPMAISKSIDDGLPWSQTISVCNMAAWSILVTVGLWVNVVIPGIEIDRGRSNLEYDLRSRDS